MAMHMAIWSHSRPAPSILVAMPLGVRPSCCIECRMGPPQAHHSRHIVGLAAVNKVGVSLRLGGRLLGQPPVWQVVSLPQVQDGRGGRGSICG